MQYNHIEYSITYKTSFSYNFRLDMHISNLLNLIGFGIPGVKKPEAHVVIV